MLILDTFPGLRFTRVDSFQPSDAAVSGASSAMGPPLTLLQQLDRWLWRQEQKRREAYLARATDRFDLERRVRHIDRAGALWFG